MNKRIGVGATIEKGCVFKGWKGNQMKDLTVGDYTIIKEKSRFFVPSLKVGDYGKIHNHALFMGPCECSIGHNFWMGEYAVINTHALVTIGNNVAIGKNAHVWTHVGAGDLLEGCALNIAKSVVIEDNVWLVGNNVTVNPGVTLAEGTVVLPHSVVTKDTEPRQCYAGVPAKNITSKVNPWRTLSVDDKFRMMRGFVEEFKAQTPNARVTLASQVEDLKYDGEMVIITKGKIPESLPPNISVFTVLTKEYTKKHFASEVQLMKFLVGYRAKFLPAGVSR